METIIDFVNSIEQPEEGYLPLTSFIISNFPSTHKLSNDWNLPIDLINIASIYLFRVVKLNVLSSDAFSISIKSAKSSLNPVFLDSIDNLLSEISDLSDSSVNASVKLASFNFFSSNINKKLDEILVNQNVMEDIREMIGRIGWFVRRFGQIERDAHTLDFKFIKSKNISIPDVDRFFLSNNSMWYIKSSNVNKSDTLLLLIIYLFGLRSSCSSCFLKLSTLGIFDPISNRLYHIFISDISKSILNTVEKKVIDFQ